jgi:hypothetical protein
LNAQLNDVDYTTEPAELKLGALFARLLKLKPYLLHTARSARFITPCPGKSKLLVLCDSARGNLMCARGPPPMLISDHQRSSEYSAYFSQNMPLKNMAILNLFWENMAFIFSKFGKLQQFF